MEKTAFENNLYLYRQLLEAGDPLMVIETFYDPAIMQVENNEPAVKGKKQLQQLEQKYISRVTECITRIVSMVADEERQEVMGELVIEYNSKEKGWMRLEEAFVQHWKNGKIIYQRFYYDAAVPLTTSPKPHE